MANQTLEQILNVEATDGPFGKGDSVLEQTLRDFIMLQSNVIAVGTKVVGVRTVPWLTFKWFTGVEGTFTYPLDDNAVVAPTKELTENYSVSLKKGQGRCTFLDSVRLRGESFETLDRQQMAIVSNRASVIDNHILTTLRAGAGQTLAVGGGTAKWNGGTAADPEQNILDSLVLNQFETIINFNHLMINQVRINTLKLIINIDLDLVIGLIIEDAVEFLALR